jgi:hypothetical protein
VAITKAGHGSDETEHGLGTLLRMPFQGMLTEAVEPALGADPPRLTDKECSSTSDNRSSAYADNGPYSHLDIDKSAMRRPREHTSSEHA